MHSKLHSLPVEGPGPHGQLAQVGPGVVHDGLVHVVPEGEALRVAAVARHLAGDQEAAVARALDGGAGEGHEVAWNVSLINSNYQSKSMINLYSWGSFWVVVAYLPSSCLIFIAIFLYFLASCWVVYT